MTALYSDVMSTESMLYSVMQACIPWSFTKVVFTWKHSCQKNLTEWFKSLTSGGLVIRYVLKIVLGILLLTLAIQVLKLVIKL